MAPMKILRTYIVMLFCELLCKGTREKICMTTSVEIPVRIFFHNEKRNVKDKMMIWVTRCRKIVRIELI